MYAVIYVEDVKLQRLYVNKIEDMKGMAMLPFLIDTG